MLKWFRKKEVEAEDIGGSEALSQIPIIQLQTNLVTTSLLSTAPINEAWARLTGEEPMSWKSNVLVRMEMLWFFLHMMNRFALDAEGEEARATLQYAITENAIQGVIIESFDVSHAEKGFDVEEWRARTLSATISSMNEADLQYGSCTELIGPGKTALTSMLREETIVGKLAGRIAGQVQWEGGGLRDMELRTLIVKAAIDALSASGLKQQVENACRALR